MTIEERLDRLEKLIIMSTKEVLTASEAAIVMGVSESRIRHMASDNEIPYYKKGKSVYFRKTELERALTKERVPSYSEVQSMATTYCAINRRQ